MKEIIHGFKLGVGLTLGFLTTISVIVIWGGFMEWILEVLTPLLT